jgi:hypothetical protein
VKPFKESQVMPDFFWVFGFVERLQLCSIGQPHMAGDIGDIGVARLAHFNRGFCIG